MNGVFLFAMTIYLLLFLGIGVLDFKKTTGFSEYAVAGKKQGTLSVTLTLLATMIGASATIGICDTVYSIGFPGIWWLVFGAVGLVLQSVFLSEKVRNTDANTLPELAGITVGPAAEVLLALIIVISWVGVIAGQLVAINGLITFATGSTSKVLFVGVCAAVIIYTVIGGQLSVVKTDKVQLVVIVVGLLAAVIYLYAAFPGSGKELAENVELINSGYPPVNLFTQFFVIGGVYFLGPDIMSRNFVSKDAKTAKKAALAAGLALLALSVVITMIGMWARMHVSAEELAGSKVLMYVIGVLPKGIGIILTFGLISAVLSSTDTCVINAATIFVKDILKKEDVLFIRVTVAVIGALATILAVMGRGDILSLLTGAYSIYTPGIIFPLLIAILAHKNYTIIKPVWLTAVILGGLFGLIGTYAPSLLTTLNLPSWATTNLPLLGMGVSLIFSLLSISERD